MHLEQWQMHQDHLKKIGFVKELENSCTHTFVHEHTVKQRTHLLEYVKMF
jgi:hypothetical protein